MQPVLFLTLLVLFSPIFAVPLALLGFDGLQPVDTDKQDVIHTYSRYSHPAFTRNTLPSSSATPTLSPLFSPTLTANTLHTSAGLTPSHSVQMLPPLPLPPPPPYAPAYPESSQGLLPDPDTPTPQARTASDSYTREASQWKIIGLAVVCVTGIALVTLSIACFDSWTKFIAGMCCCCRKKEDLGEEDFIADSAEKRDWHNKLVQADGHRYPVWGSRDSVAGDIQPGPPPASAFPIFSGSEILHTTRLNPYSGYAS